MCVYDCFIMLNELDLLEIRLNELNDAVDYFVIVEGNKTFSYKDKPFNFEMNKARFAPFLEKIIYVTLNDMPFDKNRWETEYFQRNAIMRGLESASPNDIVILSDIDEIWDKKIFRCHDLPYVYEHLRCYGYLNVLHENPWYGSVVLTKKMLDDETPQSWRLKKNGLPVIKGGWHFSYIGGTKQIEYKMSSFAHSECDTPDHKEKTINHYTKCMGNILNADQLPEYIRNNWTKYTHLMIEKRMDYLVA